MMELFERFCEEYNLDYDFEKLDSNQYKSYETVKAFLIFKYLKKEKTNGQK